MDAPCAQAAAYEKLMEETYINPFNSKRLHVDSKSAKLLGSLGFLRSQYNPLMVVWKPEVYQQTIADTLEKLKANRRKKKRGKNASHPDSYSLSGLEWSDAVNAALQPLERKSIGALNRKGNVEEKNSSHERPMSGRPSSQWMWELAGLLRRPDAATVIPQYLARLYAEITTSTVVPPKLDVSMPEGPPVSPAGGRSGSKAGSTLEGEPLETVLTMDQLNVVRLVLKGYSVFIGGSAGTGKTVLLREIHKRLVRKGIRVAMTATTGVAAVQLGGCTFHHAFNAPILMGSHDGSYGCLVGAELWNRRWDQAVLRAVDVVIVDEVSLLDAQTFDAFDMEARLARMSSELFGGIQIILCGDFLQLSGGLQEALPVYLSSAFSALMKVKLETSMRHVEGDPLLQLLGKVRRGIFDPELFASLDKPIPADSGTTSTFIFPRRRDAQLLNDAKLGELLTAEKAFVPQRGPLRLTGRFTSSALVEMLNGARMPPRSRVLDAYRCEFIQLLQEELDLLRGGGRSRLFASCSVSPKLLLNAIQAVLLPTPSLTSLLTDVDVVVMPAQSNVALITPSSASSTSIFFVRIRYPEMAEQRPSLLSSPPNDGKQGLRTSTEKEDPEKVFSFHPSSLKRRANLLQILLTNDVWEALSERVTKQFSARVVSFFPEEPRSMVPLSVSMALADMTNNDIAQALTPLRLKLGCRVMITRNLSRQVSNGSVGTVEAFSSPDPSLYPQKHQCSFRNGYHATSVIESQCFDQLPIIRLLDGSVVQIPPIANHIGGTFLTHYYGFDVLALPLQLGYAFTVHKVQGLTLSGTVVLDCQNFFDCPHLIYVACSRVTSMDQLIVKNIKPGMVMVKQSALEFSDTLQSASNYDQLIPPPDAPKGMWTKRIESSVSNN